jgi:hypothetical protein
VSEDATSTLVDWDLPDLEVEVKLARLVPFVLAALAPSPDAHSGPLAGRLPLPAPSGPLEFEPGTTEIGLGELLARLAQLTGQELVMTLPTRQALSQVKEPLESETPVPRDEVYAFVEVLLARQGVLIAPLSGGTRPILGVHVIGQGSRDFQLDPLYVGADALDELAGHAALHVRLLLNFENMDSRQLQTQIRQLLVDNAGTNQCVPVGDRGLILQGRASEMASLARLLLDADEAAGKRPAPRPVAEEKGE